TDGGNRDCVTENAERLSTLQARFPIILAGNRNALDESEAILSDFPVTVCPNVMPRFGELNIEPVQKEIRALFLSRIADAKGLSKTQELLSGILMPTPSAILSAMELLAGGTGGEPGIGDLMAIDVGGATTDVYSIGWGEPDDINIILKGFEEPYAKRTVEGDIGVRYSAQGIVAELGLTQIACDAGVREDEAQTLLQELIDDKSLLPQEGGDALARLDHALAAGAVDIATRRHAGTLSEVYTATGAVCVQTGKNLRGNRRIVLTGGSMIYANNPISIARRALYSDAYPMSLRPLQAEILMDDRYILSAMGVLAAYEPDVALRIMKNELVRLGECQATRDGRPVASLNTH
ncbi:MAG TPA: glutamate mutase L, partial [Clostridia bacterium]|nr:glutamate mutase L [Clostridia bacterium]